MITISESASSKVKEILEENGKQDHGLRLFVRGMSCSGPAYGMALDNETRPDDTVALVTGLKVLIDSQSAPYLEGAEVDYVDEVVRRGFVVNNPNVASGGGGCGGGCSCGGR
ncbi:MAG: iron-sulfur cluster assembly accessory protein [Chloroflexi bacterium]|nr:iron-sulfur cluster assembly accessory protein [Chloroflexota bacterium]